MSYSSPISSHKKIGNNSFARRLGMALETPEGTPKTNRAAMVVPTFLVHLSIGSVYGWSMYNAALTTSLGVVARSAADWSFAAVVPVFSTTVFFHGLIAWLFSSWQVRVGPRCSLICGALLFGGGMMLAGLGVQLHFLPLLYLGYGVLGGTGLGLSYVPPMANLIRWFPEKIGFAAGITSCGFGGAAFVAAPLIQRLLKANSRPPRFIGGEDEVSTVVQPDGALLAKLTPNGNEVEVVLSDQSILALSGDFDMAHGFYEVATGSSGVSNTLITMGSVYLCTIMTCALLIKKAPEGFTVKTAPFNNKQSLLKSLSHSLGLKVAAFLPKFEHLGNGTDIPIKKVMATKQFYLLWGVFISLATVGMSIAGTAKDMIFEVFGKTLPSIVTPSFAVGFVAAFSVFNLIGRIFWASFSDRFGKKNTFRIFSFAGLPLALLLPLSITAMLFFLGDSFEDRFGEKISKNSAILMLAVFTTCSLLVGSIFGGTYATVPAFATELFGRGMIEKVHGRLLTASALAGIIGPVLVSQLRSHSEKRAITQLATLVDEETFKTEFKVGRDEIPKLIAAKTLTIQRILKLAPEGTPDPTPKLYSGTLYIISSLFVVAAVLNRGITKVPKNINIKNGDMNK